MAHVCMDCGCDLSHRHRYTQRCPECKAKHTRELERLRAQKKKAKSGLDILPEAYAGKCRLCDYWAKAGFCDFATRTGRSRKALHPGESINNPCKEFRPKGGETECTK